MVLQTRLALEHPWVLPSGGDETSAVLPHCGVAGGCLASGAPGRGVFLVPDKIRFLKTPLNMSSVVDKPPCICEKRPEARLSR